MVLTERRMTCFELPIYWIAIVILAWLNFSEE